MSQFITRMSGGDVGIEREWEREPNTHTHTAHMHILENPSHIRVILYTTLLYLREIGIILLVKLLWELNFDVLCQMTFHTAIYAENNKEWGGGKQDRQRQTLLHHTQ